MRARAQRRLSAVSTRAHLQAHLSEGPCPLVFFPPEGTARCKGSGAPGPLSQAADACSG